MGQKANVLHLPGAAGMPTGEYFYVKMLWHTLKKKAENPMDFLKYSLQIILCFQQRAWKRTLQETSSMYSLCAASWFTAENTWLPSAIWPQLRPYLRSFLGVFPSAVSPSPSLPIHWIPPWLVCSGIPSWHQRLCNFLAWVTPSTTLPGHQLSLCFYILRSTRAETYHPLPLSHWGGCCLLRVNRTCYRFCSKSACKKKTKGEEKS